MDDSHASYVVSAFTERDRIARSVERRFGAGAEDHVAEAFARCCEARVRDEEHAVKWVARVASHLAIDARRQRDVAQRHACRLVPARSSESAEDTFLELEQRERVALAVAALPSRQREVVQAYAEGTPIRDIALRTGRTVAAVKHVIARSLVQLREQLRDAQLALVAFVTRRRRTTPDTTVCGLQALAQALPAAVLLLSVATPLAARAVGVMPAPRPAASSRATERTTDNHGRQTARMADSGFATLAATAARVGSKRGASSEGEVAAHADAAVNLLPAPNLGMQPAGRPNGVTPRRGAPSRVEYEPDTNDPVGDLSYCLTHVVIAPQAVYCEQPGRR